MLLNKLADMPQKEVFMHTTIDCLDNKKDVKQRLFPLIFELAEVVCCSFIRSGLDEKINTLSFSNTFHIKGSKNEYEQEDISIWVCLNRLLPDESSKVVITGRWQIEKKEVELYIGNNNQKNARRFSFEAENMEKAASVIVDCISDIIKQ